MITILILSGSSLQVRGDSIPSGESICQGMYELRPENVYCLKTSKIGQKYQYPDSVYGATREDI